MTTAVMDVSTLKANLQSVKETIALACQSVDRPPDSVRLIAVGKTHPAQAIRSLTTLGLKDFGENYAQELIAKAEELADCSIRWHFIGHLQSNKINKLVQTCARICTVSSLDQAERIARAAIKLGKAPFPIMIEVNLDDEQSKAGCAPSAAAALAAAINSITGLDLRGVFSVPAPLTPAEQASLKAPERYLKLKELASTIGAGELSLGMSADLNQAIAAGSSEVRIGTALFGSRHYRVL